MAASDGVRIVVLGGGTGLAAVLAGLKAFVAAAEPAQITAIVTVTDDGGSSGRLRRDMDVPPPGDVRNCLVALAQDQDLLAHLFQYRFRSGAGLRGHSFGNLFLAALTSITGDFHQAVQLSAQILAIRGKILPSTRERVRLQAELEDGSRLTGESRIGRCRFPIRRIHLSPRLCDPLPEALEAIAAADLISLGPGSLYTSVIPHLLVRGMARAIARSRAVKTYVCNLMGQPGETAGYTASDHVRAILDHAGRPARARRWLDCVVVNSRKVPAGLARRYARRRAYPVAVDLEALGMQGVQVLMDDLLAGGPVVRHHADRLARLLIALARQGKRERDLT